VNPDHLMQDDVLISGLRQYDILNFTSEIAFHNEFEERYKLGSRGLERDNISCVTESEITRFILCGVFGIDFMTLKSPEKLVAMLFDKRCGTKAIPSAWSVMWSRGCLSSWPGEPDPAALERELAQRKGNLYKLHEQAAIYAAGETPLHLLNQIEAEEIEIRRIEEQLRASKD